MTNPAPPSRLTASEATRSAVSEATSFAIAAPVIGIFFGLYLKYEGSEWGLRLVGISVISAFVWSAFIFL